MVNLDIGIGNINESNNGIIGGLGKDIGTVVAKSAGAVGNVLSPSISNVVQNTSKLTRNPWKTLSSGSSWGKFFKSFPAAAADLTAKTISLPFRTLEGAMTYGLANNMERVVGGVKGVTTDAMRNWFYNGGEANKFMRGMGHLVGGAGDLAGSAAKLVPFLGEWIAKQPNKFVWNPAISKTEGWVKAQRLNEVDYWTLRPLENGDYTPTVTNNNG